MKEDPPRLSLKGREEVSPLREGAGGPFSPFKGESERVSKSSLRQYIRAQKGRHTAAELAAMSELAIEGVLASAWWQEAGTLLLYYPLADEVDVRLLIRVAFESGKRVLLPVVRGDALELHLYEGEASLREGAFGIMEPTGPLFPSELYGEILTYIK